MCIANKMSECQNDYEIGSYHSNCTINKMTTMATHTPTITYYMNKQFKNLIRKKLHNTFPGPLAFRVRSLNSKNLYIYRYVYVYYTERKQQTNCNICNKMC